MSTGIAIFVGCFVAVFGIIALHECGHFIAGLVVGIPFDQMKVRLAVFPQHVALREGDKWLSPIRDHERYVARSKALMKSRRGALGYVAGGLMSQTVVFLAVVWLCQLIGVPRMWQIPVISALVSVPVLYLLADLFAAKHAKRSVGDFSGLWEISPFVSVLVTGVTISTHAAGLIYVLKTA
ncbi:MAG: hypothetical protein HZA31_02615 [Opitutae bacterium]|nr:hypothetical protein [Opitutae bacterium]